MATKHEQREAAAAKPVQTAKPERTVWRTSLQVSVPRVPFERGPHGTMWFRIITEKENDRGGQGSKTRASAAATAMSGAVISDVLTRVTRVEMRAEEAAKRLPPAGAT
ncbi:MAG TPA: hypothetical protein VJK90_11665 [Acetobacteraceae bacterium]|nr:hypothetical protein [Acetobacteraceae bacterium]